MLTQSGVAAFLRILIMLPSTTNLFNIYIYIYIYIDKRMPVRISLQWKILIKERALDKKRLDFFFLEGSQFVTQSGFNLLRLDYY